ncbi:MAG: hypothetical protein RL477_568 [Pseudomonadota bacterium]
MIVLGSAHKFPGEFRAVFSLDPRLAADTFAVTSLRLSRVLLMNDARFPWLILVPACANLREIVDLPQAERVLLMEEIAAASVVLQAFAAPDKLNVGALGNIVGQLHVHVVARRSGDAAWPGPVWGAGRAEPYGATARETTIAAIRKGFAAIGPA